MKLKMKKLFALMLSFVLIAGLLGACAPKAPAEDKKDTQKEESKDEKKPENKEQGKEESKDDQKAEALPGKLPEGEKNKVALILEGEISDMSWNATAYAGLQKIEKLGAEVKYVEKIPAANVAENIRSFADNGYNIIFLATNSYQDAGAKVAKEYPNTMFFMINSQVTAPNVRSFAIQDAQQGFLMGALAALMSKSGKVGFVGGLEIPPIINGSKGFDQGAKYVNPDIEVLSANTNDFNDVNKAKELAKSFISQGADVLAPMANQSSLGVMEAAEEGKVKAIGSGPDQNTVAPNACVVSIMKDTSVAYEAAYKSFLEGNMPMEILPMGVKQGVIYIGDYYNDVDQEIKDKINDIYKKLADGEIEISLK